MTAENPTNAEIVQDFGLAIFGPEWGAGLGRLIGINARTVTRIKAAAQDGRDYPAAAGVLAALSETLDALALRAKPFGRAPQKPAQPPPAPKATVPAPSQIKAVTGRKTGVSVDVPLAGTFRRSPLQKGGKPQR